LAPALAEEDRLKNPLVFGASVVAAAAGVHLKNLAATIRLPSACEAVPVAFHQKSYAADSGAAPAVAAAVAGVVTAAVAAVAAAVVVAAAAVAAVLGRAFHRQLGAPGEGRPAARGTAGNPQWTARHQG